MHVHYLEVVTSDVDATCATLAALHGTTFGQPEAMLGGARTAELQSGARIGVRGPMQLPGQGRIAIYSIGGVQHGLWQV